MSQQLERDSEIATVLGDRTVEPDEDALAGVVEKTIDPVTRVSGGGGQALHLRVDLDQGEIVEAHSAATLFRGYEDVLESRDLRDAPDVASRVCGDTGVVHSLAASMAIEMALDVEPPPLGIWARNMGQGAAFLYNLAGHLFLRAGPDYSATMLERTDPGLLARARGTNALHGHLHGYETVGDIMEALNPVEGDLYYEVIGRARDVQQLIALPLGKFPHPSTAAPGGVTTTLDKEKLTKYLERLKNLADFAKTVPPLWDDLLDFMLEHADGYADVGRRPVNLVSTGVWDDPDVYDARYENADEWGRARFSTPGVVVDGELRTTDLTAVDRGIEEFVDRAFYEDWTGGEQRFLVTPDDDPISPYHPWNKQTVPAPASGEWGDRYSWATAPRWDRTPMESGAFARQWITARAEEVDHPLIQPTGDGLGLTIPAVDLGEVAFRWDVPDRLNAAERLRANAYGVAHAGIACYVSLLQVLDALKDGESEVHRPFSPDPEGTRRGVAFWESGRGAVTHHVVLEGGSLDTYQVLTPSTWAASPADPFGNAGPLEAAATNTPVPEASDGADAFPSLDVMRAVRSFDPCMGCAGH